MILPTDDYRRTRLPRIRPLMDGLDGLLAGIQSHWAGRPSVLDRLTRRAQRIEALSFEWDGQEDAAVREQLRQCADRFRMQDLQADLIDRAFALLAEAAWRSLGMRPYVVQITGALALYEGYVAEMATGEGKSLTACFPAILAGWRGHPCHVLTANDYLAQRDAQEMAPFYHYCHLTVGCVVDGMALAERTVHYGHGVVYTTGKELLGDFLRDRLRLGRMGVAGRRLIQRLLHWSSPPEEGLALRGVHTAIVDEADNILIDEAATPFIISAPRDNPVLVEAVRTARQLVDALQRGKDYKVPKKRGHVRLTYQGEKHLESLSAGLPGLWKGKKRRNELVLQALQAQELFEEGKHFVILEGKIVLVDELTGRLTPNRSLGIGLHQALEAANHLEITPPTETIARFSYQKFFRLFPVLCGMSGTVKDSATELWRMYGLAVLPMPTHRPIQRRQAPNRVFPTQEAKELAVVEEVSKARRTGQPVLVGTRSVESSESLAARFKACGLNCEVLNAVRHEDEAHIIAHAGQRERITIATNMAGRGTDIKLSEEICRLGGLSVLAVEPNGSARIDKQLYGRSGRQGNPGRAQLFYSLEDTLFRQFLAPPLRRMVIGWLAVGLPGGDRLGHLLLRLTQSRSERQGFKQRQAILRADQWLEESIAFSKDM